MVECQTCLSRLHFVEKLPHSFETTNLSSTTKMPMPVTVSVQVTDELVQIQPPSWIRNIFSFVKIDRHKISTVRKDMFLSLGSKSCARGEDFCSFPRHVI